MTIFYILLAFISGALPFSVWVGQWGLKTDIRTQGDQNPGCTNVLRAGGWRWGVFAMLLHAFKGAIPVGLAYWGGQWQGGALVAVALAPILGHAFSPFLGFRGGKAVAVTFGIWAGLTLWEIPTLLGLALGIWFGLMAIDGWAMMLAMITLLPYLWFIPHDSIFLLIWLGNALILAWKHQADLRQWPRLRFRNEPLDNRRKQLMFENMNKIEWEKLNYAAKGKRPIDLPKAIKSLIADNEEERKRAYWSLDNVVVLQSDLYEAAFYVIPFLLEILSSDIENGRGLVYDLLFEIGNGGAPNEVTCTNFEGEVVPLRQACRQTVLDGMSIYLSEIKNKDSQARYQVLDLLISLTEMEDIVRLELQKVLLEEKASKFRDKLSEVLSETW